MEQKQQGFTLPELLMVLWAIVVAALVGGVLYVAFHFITKFW